MSINYAGLTEDYINKYQSRYANMTWSAGPNAGANTPITTTSGQYASGIQDAGFGTNTCTDGEDDGKIGFWSAIGNMAEGVVKGAIKGVAGMLGFSKGEDGKVKWNPLKLLGTAALVAASIACPAIGVAACTIGAVSGGVQFAKGAYTAFTADTDAEAKAAWENVGDGAATVVGCVLGAKASVGAMKSSASLSSVDDVAKTLGKTADDIVGSADDVTKAIGKNADDVIESADDVAKMTKFLKSKGIDNADELVKAGSTVDEIMKSAQSGGKMSQLSQVQADDALKGMQKVKAYAKAGLKDAKTSTQNNVGSIMKTVQAKVKTGGLEDLAKKHEATADAQKAYKEAQEAASKFKEGDKGFDEAQKALKAAETRLENARKASIETFDRLNKKGLFDADELARIKDQRAARQSAKGSETTLFGKLTSRLNKLKTDKNAFKNIKSNISKEKLTSMTGKLSENAKAVWNFLTVDGGTYQQAVNKYGYSNVLELIKVLNGMSLLDQSI